MKQSYWMSHNLGRLHMLTMHVYKPRKHEIHGNGPSSSIYFALSWQTDENIAFFGFDYVCFQIGGCSSTTCNNPYNIYGGSDWWISAWMTSYSRFSIGFFFIISLSAQTSRTTSLPIWNQSRECEFYHFLIFPFFPSPSDSPPSRKCGLCTVFNLQNNNNQQATYWRMPRWRKWKAIWSEFESREWMIVPSRFGPNDDQAW